VAQDENTGVKWITRQANAIDTGTIKFPVNLSGDFEISFQIDPYRGFLGNDSQEFYLLTSDEYKIRLRVFDSNLDIFTTNASDSLGESGAGKTINTIKLSITNNVAKIYLNDVFDGKITLKSDQSYNQLMLQEINKNTKIYELNISGGTTTTTPNNQGNNTTTNPTTTTSSACKAKYDAFAGRITIPCIEVPDAFGGIQTYYIEMQQQTGGASFDLDFDTVKPVQ
ncbi:MAG: hypothetical protein VSS52_011715, partial [Thiotrichaceae bacterium]|nr:hypothetical protein [Thiotrichaceae bacterium]